MVLRNAEGGLKGNGAAFEMPTERRKIEERKEY